ncbi:MAG: hypothetical protein AABX65_02205 [Nanoarchaeota archaeon]
MVKKCYKCGTDTKTGFAYCPGCGSNLKELDDFGLLGKRDIESGFPEIKLPFGFNTIFNTLMKQMEKQFTEVRPEKNREIITEGVSISVVTDEKGLPKVFVNKLGQGREEKEKIAKTKPAHLTKEQIEKLSTLPREEAKASAKRFGNKLIYELPVSNVHSPQDIIINRLENSIEIKAIGQDKIYTKTLPITLPLLRYALDSDHIILEFQGK